MFLSPAKAAGRMEPRFLLCPGLWDRPCCPCPQLPGQEVKSLCKRGPGTANDKLPAQEKLPAGLLQGIKHSFEAAFGQGTDSLDSYKAGPAQGAAEAAQEERSLSATWLEKNPSFLLLIKLLKKGNCFRWSLQVGTFTVSEVKSPCLGFSSLVLNFNCTVGLN